MGDAYILTVKERVASGSAAIHNREEEFALDADAFRSLQAKCDNQFVAKTRYRIPLPTVPNADSGLPCHLVAELDLFHGRLQGLRVVEVEFPSTAVADAFVPPDWFGREVSQDPRFLNIHLVSCSLHDLPVDAASNNSPS